jgi:nucleoside-diphosphate-sugar epimerase
MFVVLDSIIDPDLYVHSNVRGTVQLLELAAKYPVENFVFASSSSVYGGSKSTFFSESESVDFPISPYAASKRSSELLGWTYHKLYNIPMTGLRFFTVYGPNGRPDMAPFQFIDRISRGVAINQYGDGSSSRDYTYIDDIVNGVIRAIDRPNDFQVINLGKGSGTSLLDFIKYVQMYTGRNATIRIEPDQPGDVPYTCADVGKASQVLGYKSSVSFEDGIKRTIQWYNMTYLGIQEFSERATVINKIPNIRIRKHGPDMALEAFPSGFPQSTEDLFYMQWIILFLMIVLHFAFKVLKANETSIMPPLVDATVQKKRTSSDLELLKDDFVDK